MNQDQEHLRLLSLFHYVCAGIVALFACFPLIYLVTGLFMLARPDVFESGKNHGPPAFVGWFFVMIGLVFSLFGWTLAGVLVYAGRCLSKRKNHTFCMVAAGIACLFMPFGTVLGVFSLIVLVRPSVKALFEAPGSAQA